MKRIRLATPLGWRVKEAFEKVPFIASFGSFIDETSNLADLILPDHSFLEFLDRCVGGERRSRW